MKMAVEPETNDNTLNDSNNANAIKTAVIQMGGCHSDRRNVNNTMPIKAACESNIQMACVMEKSANKLNGTINKTM